MAAKKTKIVSKITSKELSDTKENKTIPKFQLEKFLLQVRIWSGIALIILLGLQIITGYVLAGKIPGLLSYKTEFVIHTQFSWLMIYLILTHGTVNLRSLFRRWWPNRWRSFIPPLVSVYLIATFVTLYIQFFK